MYGTTTGQNHDRWQRTYVAVRNVEEDGDMLRNSADTVWDLYEGTDTVRWPWGEF